MDAHDWAGAARAVAEIHDMGHDAIVELFLNGSDVEVPVITVDGEPVVMPMMLFEQADPSHLRTYYEKRDLVDRAQKYQLVEFTNSEWQPRIDELTRKMVEIFRPRSEEHTSELQSLMRKSDAVFCLKKKQ